jgi:hypothetical protein
MLSNSVLQFYSFDTIGMNDIIRARRSLLPPAPLENGFYADLDRGYLYEDGDTYLYMKSGSTGNEYMYCTCDQTLRQVVPATLQYNGDDVHLEKCVEFKGKLLYIVYGQEVLAIVGIRKIWMVDLKDGSSSTKYWPLDVPLYKDVTQPGYKFMIKTYSDGDVYFGVQQYIPDTPNGIRFQRHLVFNLGALVLCRCVYHEYMVPMLSYAFTKDKCLCTTYVNGGVILSCVDKDRLLAKTHRGLEVSLRTEDEGVDVQQLIVSCSDKDNTLWFKDMNTHKLYKLNPVGKNDSSDEIRMYFGNDDGKCIKLAWTRDLFWCELFNCNNVSALNPMFDGMIEYPSTE